MILAKSRLLSLACALPWLIVPARRRKPQGRQNPGRRVGDAQSLLPVTP